MDNEDVGNDELGEEGEEGVEWGEWEVGCGSCCGRGGSSGGGVGVSGCGLLCSSCHRSCRCTKLCKRWLGRGWKVD